MSRVVVLGYHTMGCVGLRALLAHGFEVAAVFTHADSPGEEIWWESLPQLASAHGIPIHVVDEMKSAEAGERVAEYQPDFLFSFYFRAMIAPEILSLAQRGALNLHGSLLPHYRGRAPVNWVLVNGEEETGVSLHYMVAKPDAGDLVDQEAVPISPQDTAYSLFRRLEGAAGTLLDRALPALAAGNAGRRPLDLASGSYFGGRRPSDGAIDWQWPASRIYNLVRAVTHPYPGAFTAHGAKRLWVWWAEPEAGEAAGAAGSVVAVDPHGIVVATGEGALRLLTVQQEGEPEQPAASYALVHAIEPGAKLGERK